MSKSSLVKVGVCFLLSIAGIMGVDEKTSYKYMGKDWDGTCATVRIKF